MKTKDTVLFTATVLLTVFLGSPALAQMPQEINFQGRLLDSEGEPVTEEKNLTFQLYDAGENAIDSLPAEISTWDTEGYYTATLDFGEIDMDVLDGDIYVGITVAGDDEMIPRLRLLPAVSALYAGAVKWENIENREAGEAALEIWEGAVIKSSPTKKIIFDGEYFTVEGEGEGAVVSTITISSSPYALQASTAAYSLHAATATYLEGEVETAAYALEAGTAAYALESGTAAYSLHAATAAYLEGEIEEAIYALQAGTAAYSLLATTAAFADESALLGGKSYQAFLSTSGGELVGDLDMNFFSLLDVSSITATEKSLNIEASTVAVSGDFVLKEPPEGEDMELVFRVNIDTTSAPGRAGILGTDSKWNVYISTGAEEGQWNRLNN